MDPGLTLHLTWQQIALRLALACIASMILGYNRDEHGRPAGMRTLMLVTLAATLAMLQVNLLLPIHGKPSDSFNVLDLMRLPLGILSGIGFIGAGAIIKKESGAIGVTTAATLWFSTMLGLLFGGGQLILASTATLLAFLILTLLRRVENWLPRAHRGTLTLLFHPTERTAAQPSEEAILAQIQSFSPEIHNLAVEYTHEDRLQSFRCSVKWHATGSSHMLQTPPLLQSLRSLPNLSTFQWVQDD
jgi:putative Mg2+ transporter-C (MgtC) family protein